MFKGRIRIVQVRSKEDLRQKGAAAVFRAACSIRRSTPRGAVGRVRQIVILYLSYPNLIYLRGPASAADPSRHLFKITSKIDLDF